MEGSIFRAVAVAIVAAAAAATTARCNGFAINAPRAVLISRRQVSLNAGTPAEFICHLTWSRVFSKRGSPYRRAPNKNGSVPFTNCTEPGRLAGLTLQR